MNRDTKIYVAGHRGLVGAALLRNLRQKGFHNIVTRTSSELDLRSQAMVTDFFQAEKPEHVYLAAAKVGGIYANKTYPAEFIHDNLAIQLNVVGQAYRSGVEKLCFLGSSCIYPKMATQPIKEEYLLSGYLEPTNEAYAVAKIAGIAMCQAYNRQYGTNYISLMPTNLYGPGDNFDQKNSHVLPALLRGFHEAKRAGRSEVVVWGTGRPRREFLYVDDMAAAAVFLMEKYDGSEIVNLGCGADVAISELAFLIKEVVGFSGRIVYDHSYPDGTPRKLLDVSRLKALGWEAQTTLIDGIRRTYAWYLDNMDARS